MDKWKQPAGGKRTPCAACNGSGVTKHVNPRYCPSCFGKGHTVASPRMMEVNECPPEPVTEYTAGDENLSMRGLSGTWYSYKAL